MNESRHDSLPRGLWLLQWAMALLALLLSVSLASPWLYGRVPVKALVGLLWGLFWGKQVAWLSVLVMALCGFRLVQRPRLSVGNFRTEVWLVTAMLGMLIIWHALIMVDFVLGWYWLAMLFYSYGPMAHQWFVLCRAAVWMVLLLSVMRPARELNQRFAASRLSDEYFTLVLGFALTVWVVQTAYDQAWPHLGAQGWGRVLWIVCVATQIAWAVMMFFIFRSVRRTPDESVCQTCGYDLTGNESGSCPECGVEVIHE